MPIRMLRDWTDSEAVDKLTADAERLFVRLIMKADDYGCFHANPRLVKSLLFPLKDGLRDADVSRWIAECEKAGLIRLYEDVAGKPYLEIRNFGQRLKSSKRKYPAPPGSSGKFPEVPGTSGLNRIETETETGGALRARAHECACEAEAIARKFPKEKVGDFRKVVEAVIRAIGRELEYHPDWSMTDATAVLDAGTVNYALAVHGWKEKRYISDAVKFYDTGMYNHDPATWKEWTGKTGGDADPWGLNNGNDGGQEA